jgi:hypothetical protein
MSVKSATKHYFKSGTLSALPTIAMQGSIEVPATKPGEIFFAGLFPFQTPDGSERRYQWQRAAIRRKTYRAIPVLAAITKTTEECIWR